MIDPEKLNFDKLADIVFDVQRCQGHQFLPEDIAQIIRHTVRKADLNREDEAYVPILFENELRDHLMREEINEMRRKKPCAKSATTPLA